MTRDELAAWWRWFSESECRGYSPLYERICDTVADSDDVLDRLTSLPVHARQPNMLLAAVHDLVLRGGAPALADHYDRPPSHDIGQRFVAVVIGAWDDLEPILRARRTQTNEIGRVAIVVPALAALELEDPPTLIDVGTSAGLTLTFDRCLIDYGPLGRLGPPDSPVGVACDVLHGRPPIRATPIARRLGLDRRPPDPTDPGDAGCSRAPGRTPADSTGPALPRAEPPAPDGPAASVLGTIRYEDGRNADARVLAHVHPHGKWIWWLV